MYLSPSQPVRLTAPSAEGAKSVGRQERIMKVTVRKKDNAVPVPISTEFIKLESAMKLMNIVPSGGSAKLEIQEGYVTVNGEVCTMRGKKLYPGDRFAYEGDEFVITDGTA